MTDIDYSAVLGDLATKRDAIDSIIAGFQQLLGTASGAPVAPPALPPAKAPKPPKVAKPAAPALVKPAKKVTPLVAPKAGKQRRLTADELDEMQDLYETGKPTEAIVKALGLDGPSLVYYHAKVKHWKRGTAPGERVCHSCGTRTRFDPCHICSKPAKKSA